MFVLEMVQRPALPAHSLRMTQIELVQNAQLLPELRHFHATAILFAKPPEHPPLQDIQRS